MTKYYRQFSLGLLMLAPLLAQIAASLLHHYGAGLVLRVLSHVAVPVFAVMYYRQLSFWPAFMLPIETKSKAARTWSWYVGGVFGLAAILLIFGAYLTLGRLVDWPSVIGSLSESYRVTAGVYLWVGAAIILLNPFLEEYFWRGFVYRAFRDSSRSPREAAIWLWLTGIFFAVHHVIIIAGWFNWWQWLIVTVFLAAVGVGFNYLYNRTESIIAGWLIHTCADLAIVMIGARLFGLV